MAFTGFTDLDADIDDAGGEAEAVAFDDPGGFGGGLVEGLDQAVVHGERAGGVAEGSRVDEAGVVEVEGHLIHEFRLSARGMGSPGPVKIVILQLSHRK